jgi:hypothetical protein
VKGVCPPTAPVAAVREEENVHAIAQAGSSFSKLHVVLVQ